MIFERTKILIKP